MHRIDRRYLQVDTSVESEDKQDIKTIVKDQLSMTRYPFFDNRKNMLLEIWPQALGVAGNLKQLTLYRGICAPRNKPDQATLLKKTIEDAKRGYYKSDKISYWGKDDFFPRLTVDSLCGSDSIKLIVKTVIKPYQAIDAKRLISDRDECILPPGQFDVDIVLLEE